MTNAGARIVGGAVATAVLVSGCSSAPAPEPAAGRAPGTTSAPTAATTPTAAPDTVRPRAHREDQPDPRWQFWTTDRRWYRSPWYDGSHRIMIGFGCNGSSWYDHDPRCEGDDGFHHGIDVAMSCGTPLRAGLAGLVLDPAEPGTPGGAYGEHPFRIRVTERGTDHDVLIAHAVDVRVSPGDRVRPGERIASASDSGAPDGCHLHFEVRSRGGGVSDAVDPRRWLRLEAD